MFFPASTPEAPRLLLIQGVHLRRLGERETALYGTTTAPELDALLLSYASERRCHLDIQYADDAGSAELRIVNAASDGFHGLLMNPGGLTESTSLCEPLAHLSIPYVEVHLSNIEKRGIRSMSAPFALGVAMGFGIHSYFIALDGILACLGRRALPAAQRTGD